MKSYISAKHNFPEEFFMKKVISVLLSVLLLALVLAPAASAAAKKDTQYPTIIVAGYSSSNLYLGDEQVWKLDTDDILSAVLTNIARIGIGLGELAFQQPAYLSNLVGKEVLKLTDKLAYNPDGTSVYPLHTWYTDAARTQFTYLYDNFDGDNVHEAVIMADIAAEYGPDGNDYIFSYQHDFRQCMADCAADLDRYIDSVLEFTGKDKVNLFAVSHGGQTVAAYLAIYGKEKNVVNNAVLTVPAIGGAALAYDVMSENIVFDEETLLYFVENGQMLETDFNWLVRAHQFGILDKLFKMLVHDYVKQIVGYWGSMWDFIPAEYYDELKASLLDPVQSADLIAKSDYWHYDVLPTMGESLRECVDKGMNIYIVAGTESPSVTGLQEQSDGIITVKDSTGSITAPYGFRFNDGYVQARTVCTDESHNHLSPEMTVDASAAYLPEYTWFASGYFHGMTWRDDYLLDLCKMLTFAPERVDVHTYEEFPQFKFATNRNYSVTAAFDQSPEGYWSGEDTRLVIKNLSQKYKMRIASVAVDGVDVRIDVKKVIYLDPQETYSLKINGTLPETSLTTADITINYTLVGSVTPVGYRTLTFTINNGPAPAYDMNHPYTFAHHDTAFDENVSELTQKILEKTGFLAFFKMLINRLLTILKTFKLA